jgi:hypothetical protein
MLQDASPNGSPPVAASAMARVGPGATTFGEPVAQDGRGGEGELGDALLAALTLAFHAA